MLSMHACACVHVKDQQLLESAHAHLTKKLLQVKCDVQDRLDKELKQQVRRLAYGEKQVCWPQHNELINCFMYEGANYWCWNKKRENN